MKSNVEKALSKAIKVGVVLVVIGLVAGAVVWRGMGLVNCTLASYDLKRETDYRFLTGRCTVTTPTGQVYLNTLRGFGDNHDGAGDGSHGQ